jgi:hypothetical protein
MGTRANLGIMGDEQFGKVRAAYRQNATHATSTAETMNIKLNVSGSGGCIVRCPARP